MIFSPKVGFQWAGSVMAIIGAFAQVPGSFVEVGDTKVSAMMMFLGNEQKVYILDKVEGNPSQINGHPAWGSEWDIASSTATLMDVPTNSFCAAGMHFPNGSWATFGGNAAVGPGGKIGSVPNPGGADALYDATYQDWDGRRAIRVLNPCPSWVGRIGTAQCQWFDNTTYVGMQKARWYASTEALADGSIVIVGGYVNGGYINRNTPNIDPAYSEGAAEPTFEFWPSSGKMFAQANFSTILWDYNNNIETPLPDMPGRVIRVYPASGAVAMLPLTPGNNYTPPSCSVAARTCPSLPGGTIAGPRSTLGTILLLETASVSRPNRRMEANQCTFKTMKCSKADHGWVRDANRRDTDVWGNAVWNELIIRTSLDACDIRSKCPAWSTMESVRRTKRDSEAIPLKRALAPRRLGPRSRKQPQRRRKFYNCVPDYVRSRTFLPPYFANIANRPVPEGLPDTLSYGEQRFRYTSLWCPTKETSYSTLHRFHRTRICSLRAGVDVCCRRRCPECRKDGDGRNRKFRDAAGSRCVVPPSVSSQTKCGSKPAAANANSDSDRTSRESRTRTVAIAVSVGGGILLAALVALIYLIRKRRQDKVETSESTQDLGAPATLASQPPSMASLWRPEHDSRSGGVWTPSVNSSNPQFAPRAHPYPHPYPYESESSPSLGGPVVSPARVYSGRGSVQR
ncbi:Glyoxal oxidase [Rhizoctonia solani]|uniref:Glyoxal oxidase n=1 Tax=Rhizoctonia solani TaxID=456999 RepID=A0A8H7M362_9AGAM|nr:Glyoxal oxidase [Rhizoctonia solani]